jgi:NAD(P) transhydrogenase subunit alpha
MVIGVPKETFPGENRVALVPSALASLLKQKLEVVVEAGAGQAAGFPDEGYSAAGATLLPSREAVFAAADAVFTVRCLGAHDTEDTQLLRPGQLLIGMPDPLAQPQAVQDAAKSGAFAFALELVPRITRAQSMDVLSSQANLAGYKAVLQGCVELPKILPMMTTAAGTIPPAKAMVLGAGVAGLQAIATAKRLGAVVSAYDVRPEVRQQIESLGGRFVELPLESAVGEGGYAKKMSDEYYAKQRELLGNVLAEQDLVVTTAAVPGGKSPLLIDRRAVEMMRPGSVIVDIAAERGGNCELTVPGERIVHNGVVVLGPTNVPSSLAFHASTLYAKNIVTFFLNMMKKEGLSIDKDDPIVKDSLLFENGAVVNPRIRQMLGLGEEVQA